MKKKRKKMSLDDTKPTEIEFSQFMHTDPLYDSEQTARYQRIKQTSQQLQSLSKLIGNYIAAGRKFSAAVVELSELINQIDLVVINSNYSSLCDVLAASNNILNNHLNQVECTMHVPVQSFIKHDLSSMKKAKNDYIAINEKFSDLYDKMATSPKKISSNERKQKVMGVHLESSHAFCEYVLQLDVTESRYNNLIGNLLVNYAASIAGDQGNQLKELFLSKKDDIDAIQENITKSNEDITQKMFEIQETHKQVDEQMEKYYDIMDNHFVGEPSTQIQGYLWKKKPMSFGAGYEKLFCVCRDGFFAVSTSPQTCAKPLWTLQLIYCDIKSADDDKQINSFVIYSRDKTITLQAPSLHDKEKWIATLMKSKNEQFECTSEEAVTSQDEERICADCGSKGADWLITNKGCVICHECASIHRSISRVRSLKMDTNTSIDQYSIQLYKQIGNDALNSILEANVGDNKLQPAATRQERQEYIHKKYVDKEFMTTTKVDLMEALKSQNLIGVLQCVFDGSINETFKDDLTALHAAAIIGSPLITFLIASNCNKMINQLDAFRWTPLMYATYYDHYFVVDCLLLNNADPSCECMLPPYVIAASQKNDELTEKFASSKPESFEPVEIKAPETEFKPEDVDLSFYAKADLHHNLPRDRAISVAGHPVPEKSTKPNLERRATLTPKGLPSLFGGKHK